MGFKRVFNAVDLHCGIPGRVITGGVPTIPGNSVFEQMEYLRDKDDQLRLLLLREPRGYPPMCCNLIVPAKNPKAAPTSRIICSRARSTVPSITSRIICVQEKGETAKIQAQWSVATRYGMVRAAVPHFP